MNGVTKGGEKPNRKIWILFVCEILAVLILVIVVVVLVINKKNNEDKTANAVEVVTSTYPDEEVDRILLDIRIRIRELKGEEMYNYIDKELRRYKGTNVEHKLVMTKAWTAVHDDDAGKALGIAQTLNEDDLTDEEKLLYYSLMKTIYKNGSDEENMIKYNNAYWALYDEKYGYAGDAEEECNGDC
jgi:hypothetical protein